MNPISYGRIRLYVTAILLAVMSGCTRSGVETAGPEIDPDSRLMRIQIQVPGTLTKATRSAGYSDTHIETIDVLSFREAGMTFQYRASANSIDLAGEWFDVVLNKSRDEQQVLVVLANLKQELDAFTLTPEVTTLEDLRDNLGIDFIQQTVHDPTHTTAVTGQYGADRPLPMWGQSEPVTILDDDVDLGTIFLLRSLAAVTVRINLDFSDPQQKPFQLVDVVITNTPDKGVAIPDPDLITTAGNGHITADKPSTGTLTTASRNAYYYSADGTTIADGIYIGEYSNTTAGMTEDDRTWLLVGGIYDNSGEVTWYRLPWIDRNGKQWDVLRNHNYIFNITKVTGPGNTEEEAKDAEIYADVIPWNLGTNSVFDVEGIYWIWIDPNSATYDVYGGNGVINVETNYPGGWTATVSHSETDTTVPCPWLTISSTTASVINYTVNQSTDWASRTGYLHVKAAGFAVAVPIRQSNLYVTDYNVTPTGNIPSSGQTRTVTLVGLFDDVPLRVWNQTGNSELVQSPAVSVPGNLGTANPNSSATVTIPGWSGDTPRTIAIQYYDKGLEDWVTVQQAVQEGYNFLVASSLANGSVIANSNQSYTITVTGTSWPTVYARAVIRGTNVVVGGPVTLNGGTGSSVSASITIGTYEQWNDASLNRTVELQWSRSNTDWSAATTLNYGTQPGAYSVGTTSISVPQVPAGDVQLNLIPLLGATLQATVNGSYASDWIQVRVVQSGTSTQVSTGTPTITTSRVTNVTVDRNPNYTGASASKYPGLSNYAGHREVQCQYRRWIASTVGGAGAWESTWTNIATPVEQLGYVTLKVTGRVVAGADVTDPTVYKGGLDWTTAMGIDPLYRTTVHPQVEIRQSAGNWSQWLNAQVLQQHVLNYSTGYSAQYGGCAAYTEAGTSNPFYLPSFAEILEMSDRFNELGSIASTDPYFYWIACQTHTVNGSVNTPPSEHALIMDLELAYGSAPKKWNIIEGENFNINRARCVRPK